MTGAPADEPDRMSQTSRRNAQGSSANRLQKSRMHSLLVCSPCLHCVLPVTRAWDAATKRWPSEVEAAAACIITIANNRGAQTRLRQARFMKPTLPINGDAPIGAAAAQLTEHPVFLGNIESSGSGINLAL